jgi:N-6 DNA Methylase
MFPPIDLVDPTMDSDSLAHKLGWEDRDLSRRTISFGETRLTASRGLLGGRSAVLFARVTSRNGLDPLQGAALYGYHTSVDWGLLADDDGLTIFNPHWLADGGWYQLGRVAWGEAAQNDPVIKSLTPSDLIQGATERVAWRKKKPERLLRPVDDELVERLDDWRDQAVRFAREESGVDEHLQALYAQLFVLRTVEDRNLEPEVPALRSTIKTSTSIEWAQWSGMIALARERVGSDLFDQDPAREIPEHVVAGVVNDLYRPRGLPIHEARYNFAWIEADVLGAAYEKYLATVLAPASAAPQQDLFLSPERDLYRVTVRRRAGAYYTPKYIRDYLASRCIDEFFRRNAEGNVLPRVIDFACGSGSFLVAAVDQILRRRKEQNADNGLARELVEGGYIVGIDSDPKAMTAARLHLWQG